MTHPPLFIDLETRSACDLREEGGYNYAHHDSTRLLTAAWTADMGATYHVWVPGCESVPQPDVGISWHYGPDCPLTSLTDRTWVGHNSWTFDREVWRCQPYAQPVRWMDTFPLALAAGLPGKLDQIGKRLWGEGKYEEGAGLLKKHSRAKGAADADPKNVPAGITRLIASYNVQDVKLLVALWDELRASYRGTETETRVLHAHDAINERGVRIDVRYVRALREMCDLAVTDAVKEIEVLTKGVLHAGNLTKRGDVLAWLEKYGIQITVRDKETRQVKKTLRREIVEAWLARWEGQELGDEDEGGPPDDGDPDAVNPFTPTAASIRLCAHVMGLRNAVLRITAKKLTRALSSIDVLRVARHLFAYHSAHTGRWAGRRIQMQNLTRPAENVDVWGMTRLVRRFIADPSTFRDPAKREAALSSVSGPYLAKKNEARAKDKLAPLSPPKLDDIAGSLLRAMFVPHAGHECLLSGDYASIESRVLAWLAGETVLLDVFTNFGCPYSTMAKQVFGRPPADKKDPIRQVGKVIVLGCGYGLGEDQFAVYGAANGIDFAAVGVTPGQCVDGFRSLFPRIAGTVQGEIDGKKWRRGGFWADLNDAAIAAVQNPRREFPVGRLVFEVSRGSLYLTLPSGRSLCYRGVRTVRSSTWWGKEVDQVVYDSPRFRLTRMYGGKWAENVVQAVSRDPLAEAMVRMEDAGVQVVAHVHDEPVASGFRRQFPTFMECLTTLPPWAAGLPLDAEGGITPRYAKSPPPESWGWPKEQLWRAGKFVREV